MSEMQQQQMNNMMFHPSYSTKGNGQPNNINNYTEDVEDILDRIRQNSIMLSREHHNRYLYLRDTLKYYRIPIIFFSSFSSVISMSQQFIPQDTITILNTVFSFVCSIIGAIELFMQISQQMVHEKGLSKDYYILASDVFKCLGLRPENRSSDGKTFLEEKYGTYVKLIEGSDIVRKNIKDKLCVVPEDLIVKHDGDIISKIERKSKKRINKLINAVTLAEIGHKKEKDESMATIDKLLPAGRQRRESQESKSSHGGASPVHDVIEKHSSEEEFEEDKYGPLNV